MSGLFIVTHKKLLTNAAGGKSIGAETNKMMLMEDGFVPNYSVHAFRSTITGNEVSGPGYPSGGVVMTGTDLVIDSPAVGQAMYTHDEVVFPVVEISDIVGAVEYIPVGTAATDMLMWYVDFEDTAETEGGNFVVTTPTTGVWYMDYTPA